MPRRLLDGTNPRREEVVAFGTEVAVVFGEVLGGKVGGKLGIMMKPRSGNNAAVMGACIVYPSADRGNGRSRRVTV